MSALMSPDAAALLAFEACVYIAWYLWDKINKPDNDNPFAGWW